MAILSRLRALLLVELTARKLNPLQESSTSLFLVEAMHAPHFLLIFKISEVRHLDVSAFSPTRCSQFIYQLNAIWS